MWMRRAGVMGVALWSLLGRGPGAEAQRVTAELTWYEGIDLETGATWRDPDMATVVFCGQAAEPLLPAAAEAAWLAWPGDLDLYATLSGVAEAGVALTPLNALTTLVISDLPFASVTAATVDLTHALPPTPLLLRPDETLLLRTGADHWYKVAARLVASAPDGIELTAVRLAAAPPPLATPLPPDPTVVPEPATGLLLAGGLLAVWFSGRWRRARRLALLLAVSVIGLGASVSHAQEPCQVTLTVAGSGAGTIEGVGFTCRDVCVLPYQPGRPFPLKPAAAPGSVFRGWQQDGAPVSGVLRMQGDVTLTAVFDADRPTAVVSVCDDPTPQVLDIAPFYLPPVPAQPPAGMSLWFDADAIPPADRVGGRVAAWPDRADADRQASQPEASKQPQYVPRALNGHAVARFDGVDDRLLWHRELPRDDGYALFIVARATAAYDAAADWVVARRYVLGPEYANHTGEALISVYRNGIHFSTTWSWCNTWGNCYSGVSDAATYDGPVGAAATLTAILFSPPDLTTQITLNGGRVAETWPIEQASLVSLHSLGGSAGGRQHYEGYFAGDIAEVLVYPRRLSPCEIMQTEQYLRAKYALTLRNHPWQATQVTLAADAPGTVAIADGQVRYTPALGFTGVMQANAAISDVCQQTGALPVTLTVRPCAGPPVIVAAAESGGTIAPSGIVAVSAGESQTFEIVSDNLHELTEVLVDGVSVGAVTSYTFAQVAADHRIAARFRALPTNCPYPAIRAGVRKPGETAWTPRLMQMTGQPVEIAGLDDWGAVAPEIQLTVTGLTSPGDIANGQPLTLSAAGDYTVTARCGRLTATAEFSLSSITWDFETGNLQGWTIGSDGYWGNPFRNQPTFGDNQAARGEPPFQPQGAWMVASCEANPDGTTPGARQSSDYGSTLTSDPFRLTKPVIHFLMQAWSWPNYVELVTLDELTGAETQIQRISAWESDYGHFLTTLQPVEWDVAADVGRLARIRLAVNFSCLSVDDFQFLDQPTTPTLRLMVQKDSIHAWTTGLTVAYGGMFRVGGFGGETPLDTLAQLAPNGYDLLIEGPRELRQRVKHGTYWTPPYPGTYTLTLTYQGTSARAQVLVSDQPLLPVISTRFEAATQQVCVIGEHPLRGQAEIMARVAGQPVAFHDLAADSEVAEAYVLVQRGASSGLVTLNQITRQTQAFALSGAALQGIGWYRGYTLIGWRVQHAQTEVISIDTLTGRQTLLAALPTTAIAPAGFAVTPVQPLYPAEYPGDERAYLYESAGVLWQVDLRTHTVTQRSLSATNLAALAISLPGQLLGARQHQGRVELWQIDSASGGAELLPLPALTGVVTGLAVNAVHQYAYLQVKDADQTRMLVYDLVARQLL